MIRVAIVDDQHLVRAGLRALLDRADDITVVGEAGDGAAGVALAARERPDVVLMDIRMPGTDGLTATRQIVAMAHVVRVLVLTTFDTDDEVFEAIRAGASGFLLKETDPDSLRTAVRTVAAGDALLSPSITRRVLDAVAGGTVPSDTARLDGLTDREREVLVEVAAGLSNDDIAATLFISPATVRTYVSRMLTKLDATSRAQLVTIAYETGLATRGRATSGPGSAPRGRAERRPAFARR